MTMMQRRQVHLVLLFFLFLIWCILPGESRDMELGRYLVEPAFMKNGKKLEPKDFLKDFFGDHSFSMSFEYNPTASPTKESDGSHGTNTLVPTITSVPTTTPEPTVTMPPSVSPLPTMEPTVTAQPTVTLQPTTTARPDGGSTNGELPSDTDRPTVTAEPTVTPAPFSPAPTTTPQPTLTMAPTLRPTVTSMPSSAPSAEPTPTLFLEEFVFTCDEQGQVALATPPHEQATAIPFDVAYLIETLAFFDQFQTELEDRILSDAIQGALNCGPGILADTAAPSVPMQTTLTGDACVAEISLCSVLQTSFSIVVDRAVAPQATAFLGYVRLSNEMPDYPTSTLPALDRVEYLRPVLFPPLLGVNETLPPAGLAGTGVDSVSVSPWTIGAVLAVCVGGVAALGVWARNRQRRNEQHMQLLENMSVEDEEGQGTVA